MRKTHWLIVIAAVLKFSPVFAGESVNSHLFRFSDSIETVILEDALGPNSEFIQSKNRALLRLSYDYVHEPLIAVDEAKKVQLYDIVQGLHTWTIGGGYLIRPRVWLGATLPIHQIELGNPFATTDPTSWKMGDMELKSKIRISTDDSKVNVAIAPRIFFPTGSEDYLVSDASFGGGVKLLVDRHWKNISLFSNTGFSYANNARFLNIDRRARVELAGGTYINLFRNSSETKTLGLNTEVNWNITVSSLAQDQNPLDFRSGLRAKFNDVAYFLGAGFSGIKSVQSANLSAYAGVKYAFAKKKDKPVPPPPPEPVVIKEWKKKIEVQRKIHFQSDSDVIVVQSYEELDSAAQTILPYISKISKIKIHGHTDSTGSNAHNMDLSQRRAESVKKYLVSKGVPADLLEAIGHGEMELKLNPERDSEDRALNRRVLFEVNEEISGTETIEGKK